MRRVKELEWNPHLSEEEEQSTTKGNTADTRSNWIRCFGRTYAYCHGTTSLLSFLISFSLCLCPAPSPSPSDPIPTPSDLVHLPSTASAPTLSCTHATMLCLHSD